MRILVTGAAGYIGSVVTEQLIERRYEVVALDSLKNGHRQAVHPRARFVKGDLLSRDWLKSFLVTNPVDAIVHLAAEALIDESMRDPGLFYLVNVYGGLNLLEAMKASGVSRIIFSSTAAVYGEPGSVIITEDTPCNPVNSYGESKLTFERMLQWYRNAYGLSYISFRYFNACGASERYGESHVPETHLVPILIDAALGLRKEVYLYGTDYDTPDGTCIRDYRHVADIARAHLLGLTATDERPARVYNLGNSLGYSNAQVIETVKRVTGRDVKVIPAGRRLGDPAQLIASSERIRQELGWQPVYSDLTTMVRTAWDWRQRHPKGYEE